MYTVVFLLFLGIFLLFLSTELFILTFSSIPRITRHARHNYQERGERREEGQAESDRGTRGRDH